MRHTLETALYTIERAVRAHPRAIASAVLGCVVLYALFFQAPSNFPGEEVVTIQSGAPLGEIAETLQGKRVVRSAFVLKSVVRIFGGADRVFAGDYFFEQSHSVFGIARIIITGQFNLNPVAITIPEGAVVEDMAIIFEKRLPSFSARRFVRNAREKEGYLFPDTYRFLPNTDELQVIRTLEKTFDEKIASIENDIARFGRPLEEVVTMASILEKEARTTESRRIIAGILWKRLDIGMPLQVDAVFVYILGKGTFELTRDDIAIDSPYNTYRYKGLPVGPIANPGLDSLRAAVTPIESDYLFYLSDLSGAMHYSETFEEHVAKKLRYFE